MKSLLTINETNKAANKLIKEIRNEREQKKELMDKYFLTGEMSGVYKYQKKLLELLEKQ